MAEAWQRNLATTTVNLEIYNKLLKIKKSLTQNTYTHIHTYTHTHIHTYTHTHKTHTNIQTENTEKTRLESKGGKWVGVVIEANH